MPALKFEVEADYTRLVELKSEIARLEKAIEDVPAGSGAAMNELQQQLRAARGEFNTLAKAAQDSAAQMEAAMRRAQQMGQKPVAPRIKTAPFSSDAAKVRAEVDQTMRTLDQYGGKLTSAFKNASRLAGLSVPMMGMMGFLNKVKETTVAVEDMNASLETFLGSEAKVSQFLGDLKAYSPRNLFTFKELKGASKSLLATGMEADNVIPTIDKLSKIASATKANLSSVISSYNMAKMVGKVNSRQFRAWGNFGVDIKKELKAMGESVSGSSVTFSQLDRVINHLTGDGGKFANVMTDQLDLVSTHISTLQNNVDSMFAELGEDLKEPLKTLIDGAASLVKHWKEVAYVLEGLVVAGVANKLIKQMDTKMVNKSLAETKARYDAINDNYQPLPKKLAKAVKKGQITEERAREEVAQREFISRKGYNGMSSSEIRIERGRSEVGTQFRKLQNAQEKFHVARVQQKKVEEAAGDNPTTKQLKAIRSYRRQLAEYEDQMRAAAARIRAVRSTLTPKELREVDKTFGNKPQKDQVIAGAKTDPKITQEEKRAMNANADLQKRRAEEQAAHEKARKADTNRQRATSRVQQAEARYEQASQTSGGIQGWRDWWRARKEMKAAQKEERKAIRESRKARNEETKAVERTKQATKGLEASNKKLVKLGGQRVVDEKEAAQAVKATAAQAKAANKGLSDANVREKTAQSSLTSLKKQEQEAMAKMKRSEKTLAKYTNRYNESYKRNGANSPVTQRWGKSLEDVTRNAANTQREYLSISNKVKAAEEELANAKDNKARAEKIAARATQSHKEATETLARSQQQGTVVATKDTDAQQKDADSKKKTGDAGKGAAASQWLHNASMKAGKVAATALTWSLNAVKVALSSMGIGLVIGALTSLATWLFSSKKATEDLGEAAEKYGESAAKTVRNIKAQMSILNVANKKGKLHKSVLEELIKTYESVGVHIDRTKNLYDQLASKMDKVIEKIKEEGRQRIIARKIAAVQDQYEGLDKDFSKTTSHYIDFSGMKGSVQNAAKEIYAETIKNNADTLKALYDEYNALPDPNSATMPADEVRGIEKRMVEIKQQMWDIASKDVSEYAKSVGGSVDANLNNMPTLIMALQTYLKNVDALDTALDSLGRQAGITGDALKDEAGDTEYLNRTLEELKTSGEEYYLLKKQLNNEKLEDEHPMVVVTDLDKGIKKTEELKNKGDTVTKTPIVPSTDLTNVIALNNALDTTLSKIGEINGQGSDWANALGDVPGITPPPAPDKKENNLKYEKGTGILLMNPEDRQKEEKRAEERAKKEAELAEMWDHDTKTFEKQLKEATTNDQYRQLAAHAKTQRDQYSDQDSKEYKYWDTKYKYAQKMDKSNDKTDMAQQMWQARRAQEEQDKKNARQRIANQQKADELVLEQMREGEAKRIAEIRANAEKEREALRQSIEDKAKELEDFDRSQWKLLHPKDKDYRFVVTKEQKAKYKERAAELVGADVTNATINYHETRDIQQAQVDALQELRDYLIQYGDAVQQRMATVEKYNQQIADKETTPAQRLVLTKERNDALTQLQMAANNIDMGSVYSGMEKMFKGVYAAQLASARAYMESDEYKNSSEEKKREYRGQVRQLEQGAGQVQAVSFKQVAEDMEAYRQAILDNNKAQNALKKANKDVVDAENKYRQAIKNGTDQEEIDAAEKLKRAKDAKQAAQANASAATLNVETTQETAQNSSEILSTAMQGVVDGLSQITSGSLSGLYNGVNNISKAFKLMDLSKKAENAGKSVDEIAEQIQDVPIVGWILSIIDLFKDGISVVLEGLLDSIANLVEGVISDVFSGDLVETLVSGVGDVFQGALNAITYGGFNSWFGLGGGDLKKLIELEEDIAQENELLTNSIDKCSDEIKEARGGIKALTAAMEAVNFSDQKVENDRKLLESEMRYSGAHHSNAYYFDLSAWKSVNETLAAYERYSGESVGRMSGKGDWEALLNLSPEALDYIRTHNVAAWKEIIEEGKYDKSEYWEALADDAGLAETLKDTLREALTEVTFDSLRDSFLDTLMDMDSDAQDFADDFSEYMMRAILNQKLAELYDDRLESWYKKWAAMSESGDALTEAEIAELRAEFKTISEDAVKTRDEVAAITGYDSATSQNGGTKGSFNTASQESIDELSGRCAALLVSVEGNKELLRLNGETLATISDTALQSLDLAGAQLELTRSVDDLLADCSIQLQSIAENTSLVVEPIKAMRDDLYDIRTKIKNL
ncbi:MAG: hypothetical protein LIP02_04075 [Bacteroidales bacterium]|nr:hypothetical protein [Bacteroidales bacterium]